MTMKEIIKTWLKANGYDGLCDPEHECGCGIDDLILCGGPCDECQPGYRGPDPSGDADFCIYASKEAVAAAREEGGS